MLKRTLLGGVGYWRSGPRGQWNNQQLGGYQETQAQLHSYDEGVLHDRNDTNMDKPLSYEFVAVVRVWMGVFSHYTGVGYRVSFQVDHLDSAPQHPVEYLVLSTHDVGMDEH